MGGVNGTVWLRSVSTPQPTHVNVQKTSVSSRQCRKVR